MTIIYSAFGIAPYLVMLAIKFACNNKTPKKHFATAIVFAITILMFAINQVSNTSHATIAYDIKSVANLLTHYAVNILWLTWPMILWWLLDFFVRFTFDLYFLGLASIHFPTWLVSILLMHTDPREAFGWVVTPFLQTCMLAISLAIYMLSKKIFKRQHKSETEMIAR